MEVGNSRHNPVNMFVVGDLFQGKQYTGLHRCHTAYCDIHSSQDIPYGNTASPDVVFLTNTEAGVLQMRHPLAATVGCKHGEAVQQQWPESAQFWFTALAGYRLEQMGPYASFNEYEPSLFRRLALAFSKKLDAMLILGLPQNVNSSMLVTHLRSLIPMHDWNSTTMLSKLPHCFDYSGDLTIRCLIRHHKLVLVIEEARIAGRVSEQLYAGLANGAIPVYWGAPDVVSHLPGQDSVVLIDDFPNLQQLAAYLRVVIGNEDSYNKHMLWKQLPFHPNFVTAVKNPLVSLPCKLCDAFAVAQQYAKPQVNARSHSLVLSPCISQRLRSTTFHRDWIRPPLGVDALDVRTYVATVSSAVERHGLLRDRMSKVGLGGDAIFAFDKASMSLEDRMCFEADSPTDNRQRLVTRRWTDGEISLAAKHISIAWDIWLNGIEYALVLEDDAIFSEEFPDVFNSVILDAPPGWDLIAIGGCLNIHNTDDRVSQYLYRHCATRCTHGYIISYSGARKLLESLPIRMPIDFQLNSLCTEADLQAFFVEPPQISQDNGLESILSADRGF